MKRLAIRRRAEYLVFRAVVAVAAILPVTLQRLCAWTFALVIFRVLPRKWTRYEVAATNIREALGKLSNADVDRIIFGMWQHMVRLVFEIVQFPRRVTYRNVLDVIKFRNKEPVIQALCSDRPVILLSGHFGNWEMSVASFGLFGFPMGVVARALDNPWLDAWFRRFRESTGHVMIDKRGGGPEMVGRLERNEHLALLADQDAGRKGVFVDFFGRPASTFKSIALLALQHDALICVGYAFRQPDSLLKNRWVRFEVGCEAVLDAADYRSRPDPVRELTQDYTSALERAIRLAPEQYFWVHRRWKTVPSAKQQESLRRAG